MNVDIARTQRNGDLKPDKARAEHDGAPAPCSTAAMMARLSSSERQRMNIGLVSARNG